MEIELLSNMARAFHAGGLEGLIRSDGFLSLSITLGALAIMSVIAMGIGLDDLDETPLARFLGFAPKNAPRTLSQIEDGWKDLETWRDLDGDNTRDF